MGRLFGRQYIIEWDGEVGRYHVTLGQDSVGFHRTTEGAHALADEHARRVSLLGGLRHGVTVRTAPLPVA
jgi:hypothetical protein